MALPRSTAQSSFAPGAVANMTFANVTFTAVTAAATVATVLSVPRTFKPQRVTAVVFTTPLQSGLVAGTPYITGNAPSDGGANYSVNIPITNATAGTLTPTAQTIRVFQD